MGMTWSDGCLIDEEVGRWLWMLLRLQVESRNMVIKRRQPSQPEIVRVSCLRKEPVMIHLDVSLTIA